MNTRKRILHIGLLMVLMLAQSVGARAQASDYTISFDLNGGIGYLSPQSITIENIGGTAALPTISNIIPPNGKAFAGWTVDFEGQDEAVKDAIKFYDGETIDYELVVEAVAYSEETSITFVAQWMNLYSWPACNDNSLNKIIQTQVIANPLLFPYCCAPGEVEVPIPNEIATNPTWRTEPWEGVSEVCTPIGISEFHFIFRPDNDELYNVVNVNEQVDKYNDIPVEWNENTGYTVAKDDNGQYTKLQLTVEEITKTITVLPWDVNNGSVIVSASDPEHTTATHEIHTFHPIYNTQDGTVTLPEDEASEAEGVWEYTGDDLKPYRMHYTVEFVGYLGRRVDHAYAYEWVNKHLHEETGCPGKPYPDATLKYYIGDGIQTTGKDDNPITVRCGTGSFPIVSWDCNGNQVSGVEDVWMFSSEYSYIYAGDYTTGIYKTGDGVFYSDTVVNLHYCPQAHSADSTIYTTSDYIEREIGKTFYVNQSPYDHVSFIDEPQPGSQQYKMFTFDILRVVNGYHVNYVNNPNMTGMPQSFWVTGEQKLPANPFQLAGHVFAGWQIEGTSIILADQETVSFSILQNLTHSTNTEIGLIPTWAKTYTISTKVEDEDHTEDPSIGSVNISVGGIPVVGNDTTVTGGTSVQLEAVTTEGGCYQFVQWSDNNTQNPRTIEVTGNINLTAQYKIVKYTIKTQVKPDGDNVHGTTSAEIVNE